MPFDITLKRDTLDGLPETVAITDLYAEDEDGGFRFVPKIEGVKPIADFDKVYEALRKEKNDHKAIRQRFAALGDRDVDEVLAQLDEVDELRAKLEAQGDIPNDKIEEMVEKRLARHTAPLTRDLQRVTNELADAVKARDEKTSELDNLYIDRHLSELADKLCDPAVKRDVVEIGRHYLTRDDNGDIVTRDESPVPAVEWIRQQLDERPRWNKPTGNGGGGRGNQAGGARQKNPFHADNVDWTTGRWKPGALKAQDDYRTEHGAAAWEQAARAAGADPARPGALPPRPTNGRAAA